MSGPFSANQKEGVGGQGEGSRSTLLGVSTDTRGSPRMNVVTLGMQLPQRGVGVSFPAEGTCACVYVPVCVCGVCVWSYTYI